MKVRATAVAAERSNAIGSIELECTPHGLSVVYLGVGAFSEGYAPGALTMGTRITVPWAKVSEARVEGEQLYLAIDPDVTPHSRLLLTGFSTGDYEHQREVGKQRLIVWIGAGSLAIVSAMLSALTLPRFAPHAGASAAIAVGAMAALAIVVVGLLADRQLGRSGLEGAAAREAFAVDLSRYLPSLVRLPVAPPAPPKPFVLPNFEGWLPRTTVAVVITLTGCLLGAVLTARWLLSPDRHEREVARATIEEPRAEEPPPPEEPPSNLAPPAPTTSAAPAASAAAAEPPVATAGRCSCRRADSSLWSDPIPKLGVLILSKKVIAGPVRNRMEVDVAAVNNGDEDIRELSMALHFFEQDPPPSNKRYSVADRSVYFEGPLTPGQAIKWSVEARGSSVEIDRPLPGDIGPAGEGAAPTNFFAELLQANHRPVRLHAARMLAFLSDPRAKEATLTLKEAMRDEETPYLDRILWTLGELTACSLEVKGSGPKRSVQACVFNRSSQARSKSGLRVRGLDAKVDPSEPTQKPPTVVAETTLEIPGEIPAQAGVLVRGDLEVPGDVASPVAFEAHADRADLLR